MKRVLTPEIIARLDGKAIRLSSPYAEGQLLSISERGEISLENPESGEDQHWRLVPQGDGFLIISAKYGFKICHNPRHGGIISAIKHAGDTSGCVWKLGKDGEIYQPNPEGGERYLWLAGGHLYATRDGFLAENWAPYLYGEKLPSPVGPQYPPWMVVTVAILLLVLIYFMTKKS